MKSETLSGDNISKNVELSDKYVWKCGSCPQQSVFLTVSELFSHRKTYHRVKLKNIVLDSECHNTLTENNLQKCNSDESLDSDDVPLALLRCFKNSNSERKTNADCDTNVTADDEDPTKLDIKFYSDDNSNEGISNYEMDGNDIDSPSSIKDEFQNLNDLPQSEIKNAKHVCKICKLEFDCRKTLSRHKVVHICPESGMYKCTTCGKQCPKYDNFTRHLSIHEENRTKSFSCEQCSSSFYNMADLKRHSVLHMTVKPFVCDKCNEGFTRQDALLIHVAKHTGVPCEKFMCNICNRILNSPSALAMHSKNHTSKTVFCPEPGCDFACYLLSQLRQHLRKHSGEKPFQCSVCGRCFARSNDMKNHILNVHERVRPFKCPYCPKEFTLQSGLRTHRLIHLDVRPYLCAECGKRFNHPSTLRKHMLVLHRDVCDSSYIEGQDSKSIKVKRMQKKSKELQSLKDEVTYVNVGVQSVVSIPLQIPQISVSLDQGFTQAFIIPTVTQSPNIHS